MIYFDFCIKRSLAKETRRNLNQLHPVPKSKSCSDSTLPVGGLWPLCYAQLRRTRWKFFDTVDVDLVFFFFFLELVTCDSTEQGRKHTCDSITREMVTILQGTLLLSCDTGGVHEMHLWLMIFSDNNGFHAHYPTAGLETCHAAKVSFPTRTQEILFILCC